MIRNFIKGDVRSLGPLAFSSLETVWKGIVWNKCRAQQESPGGDCTEENLTELLSAVARRRNEERCENEETRGQ